MSEENSTGVAFFGGASSSGNGGGVQGLQHSAAGLSPQGHMTASGFLMYPTGGLGTYQEDDFEDYNDDHNNDDSSGAAGSRFSPGRRSSQHKKQRQPQKYHP